MSAKQFTALYITILVALVALLIVLLVQYFKQRLDWDFPWPRRFRSNVKWADDDGATEIAPIPQAEAYLIAEDDKPGLPMQITLSTEGAVVLGRDKGLCDIVLRDIGVSREHARISYHNHTFQIEDMGSKGGTFLDRRRLERNKTYPLNPSVLVQFYDVSYRFLMADGETEEYDEDGTIYTET